VIHNYTSNSGYIIYKIFERRRYRKELGETKAVGEDGAGRRAVGGMGEAVGSGTWQLVRSFAMCEEDLQTYAFSALESIKRR